MTGEKPQALPPDIARPGAPETSRPEAAEPLLRDLQSLLAAAVERLRESTGCEPVAAWALRPEGEPYLAAAAFSEEPPPAPDAQSFAAAASLDGVTDLREPGAPPALAGRPGCTAAAPIHAGPGPAPAVLILGGAVRPRSLATLAGAARQLESPVKAALALARLSRLDDEARQLDRLAALGRLTGEIAHEVRNPLVSMKTFLQLLPERRDDPELLTRFFDVVNDELRRLERLLDLVIDQARPAGREAEPAAAPAAVLDAVRELLRQRALSRGVDLSVRVESGVPDAALGEDALRQVVLNLALNAVDATPDGGAVRIRGRCISGEVEISVSDEGPGISAELRSAVFEPSFSTRTGRSGGLGLSITRRIVEEARGRVTIDDAEGGGSVFRVILPAR